MDSQRPHAPLGSSIEPSTRPLATPHAPLWALNELCDAHSTTYTLTQPHPSALQTSIYTLTRSPYTLTLTFTYTLTPHPHCPSPSCSSTPYTIHPHASLEPSTRSPTPHTPPWAPNELVGARSTPNALTSPSERLRPHPTPSPSPPSRSPYTLTLTFTYTPHPSLPFTLTLLYTLHPSPSHFPTSSPSHIHPHASLHPTIKP